MLVFHSYVSHYQRVACTLFSGNQWQSQSIWSTRGIENNNVWAVFKSFSHSIKPWLVYRDSSIGLYKSPMIINQEELWTLLISDPASCSCQDIQQLFGKAPGAETEAEDLPSEVTSGRFFSNGGRVVVLHLQVVVQASRFQYESKIDEHGGLSMSKYPSMVISPSILDFHMFVKRDMLGVHWSWRRKLSSGDVTGRGQGQLVNEILMYSGLSELPFRSIWGGFLLTLTPQTKNVFLFPIVNCFLPLKL